MFDPSVARERLERLWELAAQFGLERGSNRVFLDEIVSDRLQLLSGPPGAARRAAVLPSRRRRRIAKPARPTSPSRASSRPSRSPTAVTASTTARSSTTSASSRARFATLSELGTLKPEAFHPPAAARTTARRSRTSRGRTSSTSRCAARLRRATPQSFVLCAFDLKTHVGRARRARATSCSAGRGVLVARAARGVRRDRRRARGVTTSGTTSTARIRDDLGEDELRAALRADGRAHATKASTSPRSSRRRSSPIQGMRDTARALQHEMDERGVAHLTASMTVNRPVDAGHDHLPRPRDGLRRQGRDARLRRRRQEVRRRCSSAIGAVIGACE